MWTDFYADFVDISKTSGAGMIGCFCPNISAHSNKDKNASASFDPNNGVYHCSVCGSFTPLNFLLSILQLDKSVAGSIYSAYCETIGTKIPDEFLDDTLVSKWVYNPIFKTLYDRAELLKDDPILDNYCMLKGLDKDLILDFGVRILKAGNFDKGNKWDRDSLVFPYFIGEHIVGLRYRDLYNNKGAQLGSYFTLFGLQNKNKKYKKIVISEGETDCLTLKMVLTQNELEIDSFGLPRADFRPEFVRELQDYDNIIFVMQGDIASKKLEQNLAKYCTIPYTIYSLPWKAGQLGKDYNEFISYKNNDPTDFTSFIDIKTTKTKYFGSEFFNADPGDTSFVIDNLLERNQIIMIGGPQKSLKTFLALELLSACMSDTTFCGIDQFMGSNSFKKVLIIEEEGKLKDLQSRIKHTLGHIPDIQDRLIVYHRAGFKLDQPVWIKELKELIETQEIDCVLFDPLQRLHNQNEDSSTEMARVWDNIHSLLRGNNDLTLILIHHFTKSGDISNDPWKALRGSSRTGGELDLGLFVQKWQSSTQVGNNLKIDGRSIEHIEYPEGKKSFRLTLNPDTLRLETKTTIAEILGATKEEQLRLYLASQPKTTADKESVRDILGISIRTQDRYIKTHPWYENVAKSKYTKSVSIKLIVEKLPE